MNLSALTSLFSVQMDRCGLTAVTVGAVQPINNALFGNASVSGGFNSLSTSDVDAVLVALDGNGLNNGTVDLSGQTPSAPPTGTGRTAAASLIGKGWTVTVDEIAWAPNTEVVTWNDSGGPNSGNLAFFLANADFDTVTSLVFGATGNLTSLTGLQALPALATLDVNTNALTSLDVTNCTALVTFYCSNCAITDINGLLTCSSIQDFQCLNNQLALLDVHGLTTLLNLDCDTNPLTSLNVTGCTSMTDLASHHSSLNNLDLHTCVALINLDCGNSLLGAAGGTLNLTGLTSLQSLTCDHNQLTNLDLSTCTAIGGLAANNNLLSALDLTNCAALVYADVYENPSLSSLDCGGLTSITYLDAHSCAIATLDVSGCSSLALLDANTNSMNSAMVDSTICALDSTGVINGILNITSNSAPGAAGLVCAANLDPGKGWTVTTD